MLSWKARSISAKVRTSRSEERSNLISAPQASPLLVIDSFMDSLPDQTEAVVWLETEEYLLPRDQVLVMVDPGADLVASNSDAAFEEIAEIDGFNDFSLEQIAGARPVRLAQMNQNVLGPYTQYELLPL